MNDVKEFYTVRVTFEKTGRARYISHLDLNRTMTRAVRRAGLPIWYTEGFNRHPYLTFAAPLSLGYEGERETMDIRLEQPMEFAELAARLDAVMPEGLHVTGAAPAVKKAGEVDRAVYRLQLGCTPEAVVDLLAADTVPVQKRTKKKEWKTVNLGPALAASESVVTATEDGCELQLMLPCSSADTVNPSLLITALEALTGITPLRCRVRRLMVLDKEGNPFA